MLRPDEKHLRCHHGEPARRGPPLTAISLSTLLQAATGTRSRTSLTLGKDYKTSAGLGRSDLKLDRIGKITLSDLYLHDCHRSRDTAYKACWQTSVILCTSVAMCMNRFNSDFFLTRGVYVFPIHVSLFCLLWAKVEKKTNIIMSVPPMEGPRTVQAKETRTQQCKNK